MEPIGETELHEHHYIELQQPEGIYDTARVAEKTFLDDTRSHESQYSELQQQPEWISDNDIARVAKQIAFDGTLINTEAQYKN